MLIKSVPKNPGIHRYLFCSFHQAVLHRASPALVISGVVFGALLKPKRREKPAAQTLDCYPCYMHQITAQYHHAKNLLLGKEGKWDYQPSSFRENIHSDARLCWTARIEDSHNILLHIITITQFLHYRSAFLLELARGFL